MILTDSNDNGGSNSRPQAPSCPPLPVVIAGGGCVGLFLALLLAHTATPYSIIVVEPQEPDPTSTRAMAHQPVTYPILSRVPGLLLELIQAGSLSTGLCFRTSVRNGSEVIAGKKFDNSGEGMKGKGQLLLPQGKFQEVLMRRLGEFEKGRVEVRIGQRVDSFTPKSGSVAVHVVRSGGHDSQAAEDIEAIYLIGADGAHSTIRKHLNLAFEGETLDSQLVATDLYFDFHKYGWHDANFTLDPEDFGLVGRISPIPTKNPTSPSSDSSTTSPPPSPSPSLNDPHPSIPLWRVSFSLPSHLSLPEIHTTLPSKLSRMLPGHPTPSEYTITRVAPYIPHQRLASKLYSPPHRTCLIGDAAHLTNPYAGLGLASGIADASSLSSVLSRVLTGQAKDSNVLLGSWSEARREVFRKVVDGPSRMAYGRVQSDVSTREKIEELYRRDGLVRALKGGMPVMPGSLETKGEELEGW